MKVAIIGTGNLGKSIAKGLISKNAITTLYLSKRKLESIKDLDENTEVKLTSDNKEAVINSDVIILAVQPLQLEAILHENFLTQYSLQPQRQLFGCLLST